MKEGFSARPAGSRFVSGKQNLRQGCRVLLQQHGGNPTSSAVGLFFFLWLIAFLAELAWFRHLLDMFCLFAISID